MFLAGVSFLATRRIVLRIVRRAVTRTTTQWDDVLANQGVFGQATYLVPAIVLYYGLSFFPGPTQMVGRVILAYIVVNLVILTSRMLAAGVDIYQTYPISNRRPIKGYIQLAKLVVYLLGGIVVVSTR